MIKKMIYLSMLMFIFMPVAKAQGQEIKKEVIGVFYFTKPYGHIHQNPSRYSAVLTNISCGHPLRVHQINGQAIISGKWRYVVTGPYEGYIDQTFLSEKKEDCLQDKYPKFFEALNLDISDMYFWGRLQDQMTRGQSGIPNSVGR